MRSDPRAGTDRHIRTDQRVRADLDVLSKPRRRVDKGRRVYLRHRPYSTAGGSLMLRIVHINSASTTSCSSTVAFA